MFVYAQTSPRFGYVALINCTPPEARTIVDSIPRTRGLKIEGFYGTDGIPYTLVDAPSLSAHRAVETSARKAGVIPHTDSQICRRIHNFSGSLGNVFLLAAKYVVLKNCTPTDARTIVNNNPRTWGLRVSRFFMIDGKPHTLIDAPSDSARNAVLTSAKKAGVSPHTDYRGRKR